MRRGGAGPQATFPTQALLYPYVILPNPALAADQLVILKQDLLARYDPNAHDRTSQNAFDLTLESFDRLTKSMLEVYQGHNLAVTANTLEDCFRPAIFTARKIHDTADDRGLLQLYHNISKAMKGDAHVTLQNAYDQRPNKHDSAAREPLIATPVFEAAFLRGNVVANDPHDFKTGVSVLQCPLLLGETLMEIQTALGVVDLAARSTG